MATPVEIRSIENRILDGITNLVSDLISAVQGTQGTGKITMTNGSPNVTGTDTSFTTELVAGNYIAFKADRRGYDAFGLIQGVTNDTALVLDANYTGETGTSLNYVFFTKDEYLEAVEFPSVVDLRIYDPLREHEPATPKCEFFFAMEEITDHAENALGTIGFLIVTHRANIRLMQQESFEIVHDIEKWIHSHHSHKGLWDYIQYAGFEGSTIIADEEQQEPNLAMTFYYDVAFNRPAYSSSPESAAACF